jgi:hypothetical protein
LLDAGLYAEHSPWQHLGGACTAPDVWRWLAYEILPDAYRHIPE